MVYWLSKIGLFYPPFKYCDVPINVLTWGEVGSPVLSLLFSLSPPDSLADYSADLKDCSPIWKWKCINEILWILKLNQANFNWSNHTLFGKRLGIFFSKKRILFAKSTEKKLKCLGSSFF